MTSLATTPVITRKTAIDIIGPYSDWPKRKFRHFKRPVVYSGGIGLLGVFFHCVVPLIA